MFHKNITKRIINIKHIFFFFLKTLVWIILIILDSDPL